MLHCVMATKILAIVSQINFPQIHTPLAGGGMKFSNCAQTQICFSENNSGNMTYMAKKDSWEAGQTGSDEPKGGMKLACKHAVSLFHFSANTLEGGLTLHI